MTTPNRKTRRRERLPFRSALAGLGVLLAMGAPRVAGAQSVPGVDNVNWGAGNIAYSASALRTFNDMSSRWSSAWKAADLRRLSDLYSLGAAVSFTGEELVRGRDAVQRVLGRRLRSGTDVRIAVSDFVSSGDLMSATGPYVIESSDGTLITGTYAMTLRIENARWKIRSQVFTPGLPLTPAPADSAAGTGD